MRPKGYEKRKAEIIEDYECGRIDTYAMVYELEATLLEKLRENRDKLIEEQAGYKDGTTRLWLGEFLGAWSVG